MMGDMATAGGLNGGSLQFWDCGPVNGPVSIGPVPVGEGILQSFPQTLQRQEGTRERNNQV